MILSGFVLECFSRLASRRGAIERAYYRERDRDRQIDRERERERERERNAIQLAGRQDIVD